MDKTPFIFEEHSLSFFQDLSRPTLQWQVTLKGVTMKVWAAAIPYKWSYPRVLIAKHNGQRFRLTAATEAAPFLRSVGLEATNTSSTTARPTHHWDVANVTVFIPAGSSALG
ncbi:Hypothetical predicted protein [Pelobates cultripes]|uniref:Uncharacterized protein n=1 Tax=Pelobates cultripes TaxID=61616 RepID=A0AAD1RWN2_PELCU|nr:Hypothetical predicted protein [Pelobates cultripes]